MGLDLGAELYCQTCEDGLQHEASSQLNGSNPADGSIGSDSDTKPRSKADGTGDLPAKLYSCSLCAFTSRYSNHLKRHMRTHDGQKPYRCPVCPYASAQLVNLQRHARTHTGEKPYRCHQCSYACSSLGNLRRHQRMHTQERPQRREKEKRRGRRKKNAEAEEGKKSCKIYSYSYTTAQKESERSTLSSGELRCVQKQKSRMWKCSMNINKKISEQECNYA